MHYAVHYATLSANLSCELTACHKLTAGYAIERRLFVCLSVFRSAWASVLLRYCACQAAKHAVHIFRVAAVVFSVLEK